MRRTQIGDWPRFEVGELSTSTHRCKGTSINMNKPGFEFADFLSLGGGGDSDRCHRFCPPWIQRAEAGLSLCEAPWFPPRRGPQG